MASVPQTSLRSLLKFFSLTYAVTWTCFIAAGALSGRVAATAPVLAGLRGPLFLLGTFAPAIVALWLAARAEGREGALALLRRLLAWRVGARWYVFAVGYMAAIKLGVALVHRVATGAWPRFGDEAWYIMLAAIVISTPVQGGEEIGWRGYALPGLAARFGFARGSLLLGVIWACWHLPLFFIPGIDKSGQSFPVYLLQVTAMSVALAWLYVHTNGSLLLVMLMHSAVNQTKDIFPSAVSAATNPFALSTSLVAWLTVALLWICSGYFLVRMPKEEVQ
jgi:membrane protease YdiL (CAAX protease family)